MKSKILIIIISLTLLSCKVEVKPIEYGNDKCEFCKMIVSDKRYGTEVVTKKGKIFIFDSVECLLHYLNKTTNNNFFGIYITDFSKPDKLYEAEKCFYLLSEKLPSPMGENITAFSNKHNALIFQKKYSGNILSWKELRNIIKK